MNHRPTTVRYGVLTRLTLAAALAYLCRNAVGVAESTIREDLGLSLRQSGAFMGAFFWTYAIFQVPGGWLAHRRGTRVAMTAFVLLGAIATLALVSGRVPFQAVFNLTGQPAAVVPWGEDVNGIPTSIQVVSRPCDEETLVSLSAQLEQARPWAQRRPAVS